MFKTVKISITGILFFGLVALSTDAKAQVDSPRRPVIRRVSDNKEMQVGDVFSQLTTVRDLNGSIRCVFDRSSTEVSVETFANQEGGVTLEIGEDCVVRVVATEAYKDAADPQSLTTPSQVVEK